MYNHSYITQVVFENASISYKKNGNLNNIIAVVLLQEEKDIVKDKRLLELVRGCTG